MLFTCTHNSLPKVVMQEVCFRDATGERIAQEVLRRMAERGNVFWGTGWLQKKTYGNTQINM